MEANGGITGLGNYHLNGNTSLGSCWIRICLDIVWMTNPRPPLLELFLPSLLLFIFFRFFLPEKKCIGYRVWVGYRKENTLMLIPGLLLFGRLSRSFRLRRSPREHGLRTDIKVCLAICDFISQCLPHGFVGRHFAGNVDAAVGHLWPFTSINGPVGSYYPKSVGTKFEDMTCVLEAFKDFVKPTTGILGILNQVLNQ